jgi:hypothetical protein
MAREWRGYAFRPQNPASGGNLRTLLYWAKRVLARVRAG